MAPFDFASMNVGDQRELEAGKWDCNRATYEECQTYSRSVNPSPQFEFYHVNPEWEGKPVRWFVRRIR